MAPEGLLVTLSLEKGGDELLSERASGIHIPRAYCRLGNGGCLSFTTYVSWRSRDLPALR